MLVLSRRPGQRILIGDVEVVVLRTHRGSVRLGIKAPLGVPVLRGELIAGGDEPPAAPPTARARSRRR